MITGPGDSRWSVEFWYMDNDTIYHPQEYHSRIEPVRDYNTGEITITGKYGNTVFRERIAGGKTSVDEALVSYEIITQSGDDTLYVVIRPYNCLALGGVDEIIFDNAGLLLKINGKNSIGFENKPDVIKTGSLKVQSCL